MLSIANYGHRELARREFFAIRGDVGNVNVYQDILQLLELIMKLILFRSASY